MTPIDYRSTCVAQFASSCRLIRKKFSDHRHSRYTSTHTLVVPLVSLRFKSPLSVVATAQTRQAECTANHNQHQRSPSSFPTTTHRYRADLHGIISYHHSLREKQRIRRVLHQGGHRDHVSVIRGREAILDRSQRNTDWKPVHRLHHEDYLENYRPDLANLHQSRLSNQNDNRLSSEEQQGPEQRMPHLTIRIAVQQGLSR
jgi:hypothetical protein